MFSEEVSLLAEAEEKISVTVTREEGDSPVFCWKSMLSQAGASLSPCLQRAFEEVCYGAGTYCRSLSGQKMGLRRLCPCPTESHSVIVNLTSAHV